MIFVQNLRVWDSFWCLWLTCELWGGCCKNISQGGDLAFYLRDARKAVYDAGLHPAGMFFVSGAEKRTKRDIHPNQTFPYMGRLNRSSCRSYIKVRSDHPLDLWSLIWAKRVLRKVWRDLSRLRFDASICPSWIAKTHQYAQNIHYWLQNMNFYSKTLGCFADFA